MATRILIADDDSTIRLLFRRLLESHVDWSVCGEACNGVEAVQKADELSPDVLILDQSMPAMNGLQAASQISRHHPALPILLATVQEVSYAFVPAIREAGFRGAVTKESGSEVVRAVEALLRNESFFCDPASSKT